MGVYFINPVGRGNMRLDLSRWLSRIQTFPPLCEVPFDVWVQWDQELVPSFLDECQQCEPLSFDEITLLFEVTRQARKRGDPYVGYKALSILGERTPDLELRDILITRCALYAATYGLYDHAFRLVQPQLNNDRTNPIGKVYAARVASLYYQYRQKWSTALLWNERETRWVYENAHRYPLLAIRKPIVHLNRAHIYLHWLRSLAVEHPHPEKRSQILQELAEVLRDLHRLRHLYPDYYTMSWSVLTEAYLHAGDWHRAFRLIRYVLRNSNRRSEELRAALRFYEAFLVFQKGEVTPLDPLKDAVRYAMKGGAFFRERDILDTSLGMLPRLSNQSVPQALERVRPLLWAMLDLLKQKDLYTAQDHAFRVSQLSYHIAVEILKQNPMHRRKIFPKVLAVAGLLHDVGKIFLPWVVLNRIRPFSDEEWDLIRMHVAYGASALRKLGVPGVARIIDEHHERMDGSGYPRGLKGHQISMMGAILAAADTFEAATSPNRRYRSPKSPRTILQEMKANHHPLVLRALEHLVTKGWNETPNVSLSEWLNYIQRWEG